MSKKILIIEDFHKDYDKMTDALSDNLFKFKNIYPSYYKKTINENYAEISFDKFYDDFNIFLKLFSLLTIKNCNTIFKFILSKFPDIDIYVIDKELISESEDDFGIRFYKYLIEVEKIDSKKIFIVTSHPKGDLNLEISDDFLIPKDKHCNFVNELTSKIKKQTK